MVNKFGWILVKDKFWEAYETNRLIEEFQKQDIEIQLVIDRYNFTRGKFTKLHKQV